MNHSENDTPVISGRRGLLKTLGGASAAIAASQLPEKWVAPMVDLVVLPAHAQATNPVSLCGAEGTKKTNPDECCKDMDKTVPLYLDECCTRPAQNVNGDLVTNAAGEYLCCDHLDPDSSEYHNFCCQNRAKNTDGSLATDSSGNLICCEGSSPDPTYCCIKTVVTYSASIERQRTDWTTDSQDSSKKLVSLSAQIPKWDPADGPLGEVSITISADIDAEGWIESQDAAGTVATFTGAAKLQVAAPGGISVDINPSDSAHQALTAGDNLDANGEPVGNKAGDDYWETPVLTGSANETNSITDTTVLASQYTGRAEFLELFVSAVGDSIFTGPGNVESGIKTYASAAISVTYTCLASS